MRDSLRNLISNTICFQYSLSNNEKQIVKTKYSEWDECYSVNEDKKLAEVIYNSIIDYAFNEYELTKASYSELLYTALQRKIKYNSGASEKAILKLGFYGEVLLYAMLFHFKGVNTAISRGYLYSPIENGETKGYDCYHLLQNGDITELWFGEVKFYQQKKKAIISVLSKLKTSISNDYFKRNIIALVDHKAQFNVKDSKLESILDIIEYNPTINLIDLCAKNNIKLVYPVLLITDSNKAYDESIKELIEIINQANYEIGNLSIDFSICFFFLPVNKGINIKKQVMEWIKSKKLVI